MPRPLSRRKPRLHPHTEFGKLLESFMVARQVSQADLAERSGISRQMIHIYMIRRRKKSLPFSIVKRLARGLRLDESGLAALLAAEFRTSGYPVATLVLGKRAA